MKWYDKLYLTDSVRKRAGQIKWRISHNAGTLDVYVIAFASNPENLLDIIPAWEIMQKHYPKKKMKIIGLAGGWEDALELVRCIIDETYQNTGNTDVWTYLKESRGNVS